MKDLYEILGIGKKANDLEIKAAYRRLARKYHPDVSEEAEATEKFKEVKAAYEVLSDPERRAHYDATGGTDSRTLDPPRDILMAIMKDAVMVACTIPGVNVHASILNQFDEAQDNINKRIAVLKQAVRSLKRHRGALRAKKGGVNLFHVVVDQEIAILTELAEERLPLLIKHVLEARRMFKGYERGEVGDIDSLMLVMLS